MHYALEIILLDVGDSCRMVYVCYNDEIFWLECMFPVCGNLRLLPGLTYEFHKILLCLYCLILIQKFSVQANEFL